jgi:ADP-ribose pyrophosphatase
MDKPAVPHQIRKVFEGRVFSVVVESITTAKGGRMDVEIVRHPGSVVLIPLTASGEVILVRQYRHAIGRSAWELPAGTLKPNEEPKKAAARECHEEIGLLPTGLEELGSYFPTPWLLRRGDDLLQGHWAPRSRVPATKRPNRMKTRISSSRHSAWSRSGR